MARRVQPRGKHRKDRVHGTTKHAETPILDEERNPDTITGDAHVPGPLSATRGRSGPLPEENPEGEDREPDHTLNPLETPALTNPEVDPYCECLLKIHIPARH